MMEVVTKEKWMFGSLKVLWNGWNLRSGSWEERMRIIQWLGESGSPLAVRYLIRAQSDPIFGTRRAAIRALVRLGPRAVKPLVKVLGGSNDLHRQAAAEALGRIGDAHATKALLNVLKDPNTGLRKIAADALVLLGTPVVRPLIELMHDSSPDIGLIASDILVRLGSPAVRPLIQSLGSSNEQFRYLVMDTLIRLKPYAFDLLHMARGEADGRTGHMMDVVLQRMETQKIPASRTKNSNAKP